MKFISFLACVCSVVSASALITSRRVHTAPPVGRGAVRIRVRGRKARDEPVENPKSRFSFRKARDEPAKKPTKKISFKVPSVKAPSLKAIPADNKQFANKVRKITKPIDNFTGLDLAGLADWRSRSDLIKRVTVLGIFGVAIGGLGLQIILPQQAEKKAEADKAKQIVAEAKAKAEKEAAAKVAAAAAAAKKKEDDAKKAAEAANKPGGANDPNSKANKKKAEEEKKKQEELAREAAQKIINAEQAAKNQAIFDAANKKQDRTAAAIAADSKSRRDALMKQFGVEDTLAKSVMVPKK